jgi:hypothetical protein
MHGIGGRVCGKGDKSVDARIARIARIVQKTAKTAQDYTGLHYREIQKAAVNRMT